MPGQFDLEDDEDLEEEPGDEGEGDGSEGDDDEGGDSGDPDDEADDDDADDSDDDPEGDPGGSAGEGDDGTPAGAENKSSGKQVPLAALQDERRKRQALERRLELMEARFQGMDSRKPNEAEGDEEPEIVFNDDEFLTEPSKALLKQRAADKKRQETERRTQIFEADLEDASLLFDDFEEVFTDENVRAWKESTPGAEAAVAKSHAPVKLAYRQIKKMKAREAAGNGEADEKLRSENADLKKKLADIEKRLSKPTRSVGRNRSTMRRESAKDPADSPFRTDW